MTFQAAMTVTEAASVREDDRILREVQCGPDAIAADARYHRSCYAAFTDRRALQKLLEKKVAEEDGPEDEEGSPYQHHLQNEIQR